MALVYLRGEGGTVVYFDRDALPEGIASRLTRGDLVAVNADGTPLDDGTPEITDDRPPDAPALPSVRASRQAWADFAMSQGMDRDQAAAMTKAALIEEFTKLRAVV